VCLSHSLFLKFSCRTPGGIVRGVSTSDLSLGPELFGETYNYIASLRSDIVVTNVVTKETQGPGGREREAGGELIHSNHASCVVGSLEPSPSTDGLGGIKRGNAEKHTPTFWRR
jgi:hypothetical protein